MNRIAMTIAFSAVLFTSLMFLYFPMVSRHFDWIYFDSLALVIKSSILNYGTLPLHNPWVCSGSSILSNPQNWIFSPMVLLTLVFPVTLGNILSVIVLKLIGFWGTYKYLSHQKVSKEVAFLGAALFINASWFALHFSEGHIAFRTFFLIPWAFLWIETLDNRKSLFKLGVLFSFMLIDGGFYPFIFSLVYCILYFSTSPGKFLNFVSFLKHNFWFVAGTIFSCLLLTLPKIYPIMKNTASVREVHDHQNISLSLFLKIFFDPFTNNTFIVQNPYRFHEYGNYLGIAVFGVIALFTLDFKKIDKVLVHRLLLIFIFLWIAMGWGDWFNPYELISSIPYVKKAHLQSRYLIVFTLLFVSFISMLASRLKFKKVALILMSLANLEALVVNYNSFGQQGTNYELSLITRDSWTETQWLVYPPKLFYTEGVISKNCYEPSQMVSKAKAIGEKGYVGEVNSLSGDAKIGLLKLTPGEITFNYESKNGAEILLNTNFLDGWIESNQEAEPFNHDTLLAVRLPPGQRTIRLQYFPSYYNIIILSCLAGLIGLIFLRKKSNEL